MANDYIPRGDANLAGLGLAAGDMTPVTTAQTTWNSKYLAHVTAAAAAISAREGKDIARQGVEAAVRPLVRRLQASPSVDNTERAALGITVPDKEPSPVGPPTTRPVATVDASQRLQHTIDFTDESTPTRRAKPAGESVYNDRYAMHGTLASRLDRSSPSLDSDRGSDWRMPGADDLERGQEAAPSRALVAGPVLSHFCTRVRRW